MLELRASRYILSRFQKEERKSQQIRQDGRKQEGVAFFIYIRQKSVNTFLYQSQWIKYFELNGLKCFNSNPYPVYGTEIEDQVFPSEDTIKTEPSDHLKHYYAEVGVSLKSIQESSSGQEQSSLHTETSQTLNPSVSSASESKSTQNVRLDLKKIQSGMQVQSIDEFSPFNENHHQEQVPSLFIKMASKKDPMLGSIQHKVTSHFNHQQTAHSQLLFQGDGALKVPIEVIKRDSGTSFVTDTLKTDTEFRQMESRGEGISKKSHSQLDIPFKKLGSIKHKKRSSIQSGSQTSRQDKDKKKSSNVLNVPMFERTGTIKDSIGAKIEELLVEEQSSSSSDSSINFTKKSTPKEEYKVEQFYREINNEIKSPKVDLEEEKVSLEFGNEGAQAFESDQEDPISQQMGQNQFRHESPFVKTQIHQKLSKNDIFKSPRVDTAPQIFLQFSPSKHVTQIRGRGCYYCIASKFQRNSQTFNTLVLFPSPVLLDRSIILL